MTKSRDHKKQTGDNVLPGRNQPCSCGSKRKFKKCCGAPPRADRYAAYENMEDYEPMLSDGWYVGGDSEPAGDV